MKKYVALVLIIIVMFILVFVLCLKGPNKENNNSVAMGIDGNQAEMEVYGEKEERNSSEVSKKNDSANDMEPEEITDYLFKYCIYENYESSLEETFIKNLNYYFPNAQDWSWGIPGKAEDNYVLEVESWGDEKRYQVQVLLKPDFSTELLEDTIKIDTGKGFCIYKAEKDYVYHGCRIVEYHAEYYDQDRDLYFEAVLPLFSLQESGEWNDINRSIWEGLEEWIVAEDHHRNGRISLDYEIKRLDDDLYSILFSGEYEQNGEKENVDMGITISMGSDNRLSRSVFITDEQSKNFYEYYIDDNELYIIINENEISKVVKDRKISFLRYRITRNEKQVYAYNGRWIGQCYYELPEIRLSTDETKWINQQMKKDMGKFFNGLAKEFEKKVLILDEGIEYGAENDYATIMGSPGYHCYVESEVIYNSEGKFGVMYHYTFFLGGVHEEGEAVAVYNLEKEVLEYDDWQGEIMKKVSAADFG